jgi:hypothetical protein
MTEITLAELAVNSSKNASTINSVGCDTEKFGTAAAETLGLRQAAATAFT